MTFMLQCAKIRHVKGVTWLGSDATQTGRILTHGGAPTVEEESMRELEAFSRMEGCPSSSISPCSISGEKFCVETRTCSSLALCVHVVTYLPNDFSNRCHNISVKATAALTQLPERTVVMWHKKFRSICRWWIRRNPRQIGGKVGARRLVVEIDEALVGKRKYNRGRLVRERWIFGGYCQETAEGFLVFVRRRDAGTLLPLIVQHIAPGSRVMSDCWGAYRRIRRLGWQFGIHMTRRYHHTTVNHSRNFVDPYTNTCTNRVENFWMNAKRKLKAMQGVQSSQLKSHLWEFLWRHRNGGDGTAAFNALIRQISERYDVNRWSE